MHLVGVCLNWPIDVLSRQHLRHKLWEYVNTASSPIPWYYYYVILFSHFFFTNVIIPALSRTPQLERMMVCADTESNRTFVDFSSPPAQCHAHLTALMWQPVHMVVSKPRVAKVDKTTLFIYESLNPIFKNNNTVNSLSNNWEEAVFYDSFNKGSVHLHVAWCQT